MATSIIDGTVAEAVPGRRRGATTVFKSIRFERADGSSQTLNRAVVKQPVADALRPGAQGRFYLFNAFDLKGVHGVRTADGSELYAFPSGNRTIFLVIALLNLAFVAFKLAVDGELTLLGLGLLILGVVGWIFMGKGETEARRQFDGDPGPAGPVPAPTRPL